MVLGVWLLGLLYVTYLNKCILFGCLGWKNKVVSEAIYFVQLAWAHNKA